MALRQILHTPDRAQFRSSTALHQSLFHPSILSLISAFSTPSAEYHVLEHCPHGSLHEFLQARDPPVLSEAELQGMLKSLIPGLSYLHKHLVCHRNLNPRNILFTEDYRPVSHP